MYIWDHSVYGEVPRLPKTIIIIIIMIIIIIVIIIMVVIKPHRGSLWL